MGRKWITMMSVSVLLLVAGVCLAEDELTLATTTSTADTGLLDAILPAFEKYHSCKVKVIAAGTGQALKLARDGNADVVLVHARAKEDEFIAQGWGTERRDVMYNDFVIVGPASDPAGVRGKTTAADVLKAIAQSRTAFVSRGDESGTHVKEKEIWKTAGTEPDGDWYKSVGQGMGETLMFANEKAAYALSDRGTFLAMRARLPNLTILFGGENISENPDPSLQNPYGVIALNPAKHAHTKHELAIQFIQWITSPQTQKEIGAFGVEKFGQALFHPVVK